MKIAHHNISKANGIGMHLDSYRGLGAGQTFLPSSAEDRPYDWSSEEDWSDGKPEARTTIVINSTPQPLEREDHLPISTVAQRCIKALAFSGALARTFVLDMKEMLIPEDQLAEIRRLSEEEGVSTIVHIKW